MIGFAMSIERYIAARKDVPKDNASAGFPCYLGTSCSVLLRGVEEVVGGIGDAYFLSGTHGVAAGCGRFAAFGVEALDGCGAGEHAAAFMAHDIDEKPGNGISVGRRHVGDG